MLAHATILKAKVSMYFTEDDLRAVIQWSMYHTSRSVGIIGDDDTLVPQDAVDIISKLKNHKDALSELADAYGAWYAFHLKIYKAGKSGKLSPEENNELANLILRRDAAKDALLAIAPV